MKKLMFFSFLLFFGTNVFAQNKTIDSLKLALKIAKHDTAICNILCLLMENIEDENVRHSYDEKLLRLAEKRSQSTSSLQNFYLKHLAIANNNFGTYFKLQGDLIKAIEYHNKSLEIRKKINDKAGIATSLVNLGSTYNQLGEVEKALQYYKNCLEIREEIGDEKGSARSLNNIGAIYYNQGNVQKALEYFERSLKTLEKINDNKGVSTIIGNIGSIYLQQGELQKAQEYFIKSLKLREKMKDKNGIGISYNNLAGLFQTQKNYPKALEYYNKSLNTQKEIGDKDGIARSLNNIGFIYYQQDSIEKSLDYYNKSLKIREEIGDKEGIASSFNNIGSVYLKQKNYSKALEFILKAMQLSKELGFPKSIEKAAKQLNSIYKVTGNYKAALDNYELYIQMRDSINNQENKKASIKSQFKYEYEKKAAADSVKVAEEKKVVAIQLKQEKTQRFALYGGLMLVLVFAGFMFNRFRVTQRQKNIIELKEKETQFQKHIIEEKHKEITDSINYAERIQRSFLATKELLDENLREYFVLFKPKDVVSGDFYWAASTSSATAATNKKFMLCTADSTGHGVPGAIMSLLNVTSLEKAIEHHINPAEILNHTRQTIIERLKKDGSEGGGKDGMDCSLLACDFENKQLLIAAANNPVWIIRNLGLREPQSPAYELIEIKPDKMPVGKSDKQNQPFTLHTIELQKGDTIYTLTDGFPDQFGGPNGKKFMSKKLKELLLENVHLPMPQQKELLDTTFKNWIGDLEQVDDVCVVGVRI